MQLATVVVQLTGTVGIALGDLLHAMQVPTDIGRYCSLFVGGRGDHLVHPTDRFYLAGDSIQ